MKTILAAALVLASIGTALAQPYPSKPVRVIVGFPAGGGVDITARIFTSKLSEIWGGSTILVENRVGAGSTVAADMVVKSPPDGYTLMLVSIASHGIAPSMYKKLPYDTIKDFAPISLIGKTPNVLNVHPSLPARSVQEFVALAKASPGKIQYGSSGVGTSPHLSMELFKNMARIDIMHIPYKGGAPALADLMGGHVSAMLGNLPEQIGAIKAGKVRAIGISSVKRNPLLPNVPTIADSGVPGFEVTAWYGVAGPAAMPKPVQEKLHADMMKALKMPDLQQKLLDQGIDPAPLTQEQFADFIKSEIARWNKVATSAGIKPE
jgi:tripartite-type tricarboxylate transporter receptor subunit TctC